MARKLEFHFPMETLLKDGDLIISAGETFATELAERLEGTFMKDTRGLLVKVVTDENNQKIAAGELGTLTLEQKKQLKILTDLIVSAKETAKKAFKGQKVKLHDEFQVGINEPKNLGAVTMRGGIILASIKKAENNAAVAAQGWIAADTTKMENAIKALGGADLKQEDGKGDARSATDARNADANELYRRVLAIQNAANLQFPESDPANVGTRIKFRLGIFPPSHSNGGKNDTPPNPPTPPTPPSP